MQNKIESAKKQTANKNLANVNLSKVLDKFKNVKANESITVKKETVYIYPETFTQNEINTQKGRGFRASKRNILLRFANNIKLFADKNRIEDLINEIKLFKIEYKNTYRLNNFTVESVTRKNQNSSDYLIINAAMEIVKVMQTEKKETVKKPKAKKEKIAKVVLEVEKKESEI